jgi:telomere length regulation protein
VNVQLLLLSAGYAQRLMPQSLHRLARSSTFLNGVSNRLGASSTRARFLGMIVGESISEMTNEDGKAMKFGVEETATEEAKWWKSIRHVEDTVGSVVGLDDTKREMVVRKKKQSKPNTETQMSSVIQVIEEIEDEDEEDDDLRPYPKPDSDIEDSDDDPTLINRKKDTAPVYVNPMSLLQSCKITHIAIVISVISFSTSAQQTPTTANSSPSSLPPPLFAAKQVSEKSSPTTLRNSRV